MNDWPLSSKLKAAGLFGWKSVSGWIGTFSVGGSSRGAPPAGSGVVPPEVLGAIAVSVCASSLYDPLLEVWNGKLQARIGIINPTIIVKTILRLRPALLMLLFSSPITQLNEIISSYWTSKMTNVFRGLDCLCPFIFMQFHRLPVRQITILI